MQRYVVGWDIADARNLKPEGEGTCDPFVVVQCCGKTYKTQVKENKRLHVPINESQIWNDIDLDEEQFETAYIEFSVYARNFWWRDYLIGKASLQLASINHRKASIYSKKTVPLRKENDPQNTGSITLTVWVLTPGDSAPTASQMAHAAVEDHEGEKEEFDVDLTKAVLGDKEAQQAGARYHLFISVFRVEDLAKVKGQYPSPFVTVEFAGACKSTEEGRNTSQYTFNNEIRIPVQQPICEDAILIKLWHKGSLLTLTPDMLLAQGLISFSELRNNALKPKWFCLYGWDPDEVDVDEITRTGERIPPNFFKGRLLVSGRVERVADDEELRDANNGRAQQPVEPEMRPVALLADVYQVCGAVGKECQVRLAFGARQSSTEDWVTCTRRGREAKPLRPRAREHREEELELVDQTRAEHEDVVNFHFSQKQGRMPPLLDMTTEEPDSQPYIMVNIYTRGIMSGELRVGYGMKKLLDFTKYDPGSPSKPRFIPLEPMPNLVSVKQRTQSSVLMVIEQHTTDDVQRHDRKTVKPMLYIVRAYIFMARNIMVNRDKKFAIRVTCAGVSKYTTECRNQVRPLWMQCLELEITLCSDHPKEQPTMYPITLTLCDRKPFLAQTRDVDIGKTVCIYEYMRRKDDMDRWEPFKLKPQWVQLKGGTYGTKVMGEALVSFELLHSKDCKEEECQRKPMWPAASEEEMNGHCHFSYLRKATLHVAMYGVRDLKLRRTPSQADMDPEKDLAPMIEVRVKKFVEDDPKSAYHHNEQTRPAEAQDKLALVQEEDNDPAKEKRAKAEGIDMDTSTHYVLGFKYREAVDGGDKDNKDDRLIYWYSDALGTKMNLNYEVLRVKTKKVALPDKVLLEPFISIRALERPTNYWEFKSTKSWLLQRYTDDDWQQVGEYRQGLSDLYPCKWLNDLYNSDKNTFEERDLERAVEQARLQLKAKPQFEEESREERLETIKLERDKLFNTEKAKAQAKGLRLIEPTENPPEGVDKAAMPLQLRCTTETREKPMPLPSHSSTMHQLNMFKGNSFEARKGEKSHKTNQTTPVLDGKLESRNTRSKHVFTPDFYFENRPLLRNNHDLIDPETEKRDWNYYHQDVYGFVKCVFKLTDGWEGEEEDSAGPGLPVLPAAGVTPGRPPLASHTHWGGPEAAVAAIPETGCQAESRWNEDGTYENGGLALMQEQPQGRDELAAWAANHERSDSGLAVAVKADVASPDRAAARRDKLLHSSFGLSDELEEFAFCDAEKGSKLFAKRFKGQHNLPSRIRVRIYFVKAICIMGKPGGQDPYLSFKLGKAHDVCMRNMYQPKTSKPCFYRVEERDIRMPEDSRLQIDMYDFEESFDAIGPMASALNPEQLIGSTTIDLEDRWHSRAWRKCTARKRIPPEQRPLYHPEMPGQNCGSIEMWVEMLESMRASEEKATDLRKPPEEQVEVRFVIWTASEVPLLDGSGSDMWSDCQIMVKLECNQYRGERELRCPKEQQTDVHNHCTGNATFNWRIVFPRITVPAESCTVDITLKEVNALSERYIGQLTLDIRKYVEKVGRDMESVHSQADLKLLPIDNDEDANETRSNAGRVQLDMWVLTQEEATEKLAGRGRDPPNEWPPLHTPAEGRGWGDVLAGVGFEMPSFGLFWKVIPLILFTLACLVGLRFIGLL